jgi:hypothetical protein
MTKWSYAESVCAAAAVLLMTGMTQIRTIDAW